MYIDTSVAVKLFTREPDSDACESTVGGFTLVSSELTYCELRSALRSKKRDGLIPFGRAQRARPQGGMLILSHKNTA